MKPHKDSFYEFHRLKNNCYGILLGRCVDEQQPESLFNTAIVCGMVKTLMRLERPRMVLHVK